MTGNKSFSDFFDNEKAVGLALMCCTIVSLFIANSPWGTPYVQFWQTPLAGLTLAQWINEGLMTIFFFWIGLELVNEIRVGQLSTLKGALLPIFGAIGGMGFPAGFYLLFNYDTHTQSGAGIPMATDIAFAIGILTLLGKSVPPSLKIFLTALAVIDDLGAILLIATFYSNGIAWTNLLIASGLFLLLLLLNKRNVKTIIPYLIGGVALWYFMLHSGVHATIAGVLLALVIPVGTGKKDGPAYKLGHLLHKPVNFFILPVFALANTAILMDTRLSDTLLQNHSLGIAAGLVVGKPIGIFLLSFIAVKLRLCKLPAGVTWKTIFSVGFFGGIGFTMSIFITLLAFDNETVINSAKLVILLSSLTAGGIGLLALKTTLRKRGHTGNKRLTE